MRTQASAFAGSTRVYAPYYRHATMIMYGNDTKKEVEVRKSRG